MTLTCVLWSNLFCCLPLPPPHPDFHVPPGNANTTLRKPSLFLLFFIYHWFFLSSPSLRPGPHLWQNQFWCHLLRRVLLIPNNLLYIWHCSWWLEIRSAIRDQSITCCSPSSGGTCKTLGLVNHLSPTWCFRPSQVPCFFLSPIYTGHTHTQGCSSVANH